MGKTGLKSRVRHKNEKKQHNHILKSQSRSSSKQGKTSGLNRGNGKKSSLSLTATGSKTCRSVSSKNLKKQDKRLSHCLNRTLEIVEKRYNVHVLNPTGVHEAYLFVEHEWEVSQIEKWSPQMHHLINLYPVYGMDRDDLEQEMRLVIMRCLRGYRGDSLASFQTYLYQAMLNKLMALRTKESHRFKLSEKVTYNKARVSDPYEEIEILSGNDYSKHELEIMKAAMKGLTAKDIREAFDLSVREFNKIRRVIGEKMLQADPELSSVLKPA